MSQQEETRVEESQDAHSVHTGHPTPATYFKVAMALSILTAIEVGIFYITALSYAIIPILAIPPSCCARAAGPPQAGTAPL